MRRHFTKTASLFLALAFLLGLLPAGVSAAEAVASGSCGDALTWTLDSDGVLRIEGTGPMWDDPGFDGYEDDIASVVIGDGVTTVGSFTFADRSSILSVSIPDSVTAIGDWAFSECAALSELTIGSGVEIIGDSAFFGCGSLTGVTIPEGTAVIGDSAFSSCRSLARVAVPDSVTAIGVRAFSSCGSLAEISVAETNPYFRDVNGVLFNKTGSELIQFPGGRGGSYTVPAGVTAIGGWAFAHCRNLTGVTLPDSVTTIGEKAFGSCAALKSVTVPDSVTDVGVGAFSGCGSLSDLTIGSGVTAIGASAFSDCVSLTGVTVPDSVTTIGYRAFYRCSALSDLTIGSGVTAIGAAAFSGCKALTGAIVPDSVAAIGDEAFSGCSLLSVLAIGTGLTTIGRMAFYGDSALTDVYYGGSPVEWAAVSVGADNDPLMNAGLHYGEAPVCPPVITKQPEDYVGPVGSTASFAVEAAGAGLSYQWYVRKASAVKFSRSSITGSAYSVELTEGRIGNQLYCVVTDAFGNTVRTNTVTMTVAAPPVVVTQPEDYAGPLGSTAAFTAAASGAEPLAYQWWVKSAGDARFSKSKIKGPVYSVTLTEGRIGNQLYCVVTDAWGGTAVTDTVSMTLRMADEVSSGTCGDDLTWSFDSDGVLRIEGTGAMELSYPPPWGSYTEEIAFAVIGSGVTEIGNWAFANCGALTGVSIPASVTVIDSGAFARCTALRGITLPDNVTTIGEDAFCDCDALTGVSIPASVTDIGDRAFFGCDALAAVTVPASVTDIGTEAFADCRALTGISVAAANPSYRDVDGVLFSKSGSVLIQFPGGRSGGYTIPDGVTDVGTYAFYNCGVLTSVTVPDSVTAIGDNAFYDCAALSDLRLGSGVTVIGTGAFAGCRILTGVTVPDSVTAIGDWAFSRCPALSDLKIGSGVTAIGSYAFYGCRSLTDVTVPEGVTAIGDNAFYCCASLSELTLGSGVTSIGNHAFYSCSSLTGVTLPDSVETVGAGAFCFCSALSDVRIGSGVTTIGNGAFYGCGALSVLMIGSGVTAIGDDAFGECGALTEVYYAGSPGEWAAVVIGDYNESLLNAGMHYGEIPANPPVITKQPEDYIGPEGSTATFTVLASGDGLSYQWWVKKPKALKFSRSSITGDTYSVTLTGARNGNQVYCVVTDAYGNTARTGAVRMRVAAPVIVAQPEDYVGPAGSTASFTVQASGSGLSFQWYVKKPTARKFSRSSITGATYSVTLTEARSGNQVYCVVTDAFGQKVRTNTATMTVG